MIINGEEVFNPFGLQKNETHRELETNGVFVYPMIRFRKSSTEDNKHRLDGIVVCDECCTSSKLFGTYVGYYYDTNYDSDE